MRGGRATGQGGAKGPVVAIEGREQLTCAIRGLLQYRAALGRLHGAWGMGHGAYGAWGMGHGAWGMWGMGHMGHMGHGA